MGAVYEFIRELQSFEEYAFSVEELRNQTEVPESTLRKELTRLTNRVEILNLRKGFYLIIPPTYKSFHKIPINFYVDKLFQYLEKPYYVAFYSAAAIYGASHQQLQEDYIMTKPPALRAISRGNIRLNFHSRINWPTKNIVKKKSDAGYYNLSSPALTIADLLESQHHLGGLHRMMPIVEELAELLEDEDVLELLSWYKNKTVLQRMGFILEKISLKPSIQELLYDFLKNSVYYTVLLSPEKQKLQGTAGNRWKVNENHKFESLL